MSAVGRWDVLIMCTGSQGPIGNFISINFENWRESFEVNFIAQMQFIHVALHARNLNKSTPPIVIMFAGGGTNSAPKNYSAYTVSKIASIKMCELLSVEVVDTTFSIIGPGWVKTKIHDATLLAGTNAGESYEKTKDMLESNNCIPIERVVACCDWLINADPGLVNGRNFSVAYDPWDKEDITSISKDNNNFKLRRFGSDIFKASV
jgi:NAD(P)-dependent dehydrogenase (short-subunit alcohol dehydrogenase family)